MPPLVRDRRIVQLSPANGNASGGTAVSIHGTGFTGATGLKFGTTPGSAFTVKSDSWITGTAPAHAAGVVDVTVQHPAGDRVGKGKFTYA